MRILHLIHQFFPYSVGGSEVYTYELVQEQRKHHDIAIFSAWRNSDLPEYLLQQDLYEGIPVIRLVNNYKNIHSFQEGYDNPKIDKQFEGFVQEYKPDVVHIHHLSNLSFGIVRLLKRIGIPMIMTLHDFWMVCPRGQRLRPELERCDEIDLLRCTKCIRPWLGGDGYPFEEQQNHVRGRYRKALDVLDQIDLLISPSLFLKKEFVRFGISPAKILFLEYGRDTRQFEKFSKTADGGRRFGYIGTLIPSKGVHVLLEAWKRFKDNMATLQIYGMDLPYDGWDEYEQRLREFSRDDPCIQWMGGYTPQKVSRILSSIDVLIVPSIWYENSPLTIQEAQLSQTVVLASRIGGIPEKIVPGKNGFLFEAGSIEGLLRCFEDVLFEEKPTKWKPNFAAVTTVEEHVDLLNGYYRHIILEGAK